MEPYYKSDGITIYNARWEDVLPSLPRADLFLTDPPYEIVAKGGGIGSKRDYLKDIEGFTDCGFDTGILDYADNWACFCAKAQLPALLNKAATMPRWMLVTWNKPNPTPLCNGNYLPDTEYIVHGFQSGRCFGEFRDKSRFIVHPARQNLFHPNEKPITVLAKMIAVGTKPGDLVVDPFAGSMSTLVAAKREGRPAIGIEPSAEYCDVGIQRLRQGVLTFAE